MIQGSHGRIRGSIFCSQMKMFHIIYGVIFFSLPFRSFFFISRHRLSFSFSLFKQPHINAIRDCLIMSKIRSSCCSETEYALRNQCVYLRNLLTLVRFILFSSPASRSCFQGRLEKNISIKNIIHDSRIGKHALP